VDLLVSRLLYQFLVSSTLPLSFDSGVYRNRLASHMHSVPGFDHRNPKDLRDATRNDISSRYNTVAFADNTKIVRIEKTDTGLFQATAADGNKWTGRKVVLATGVRDIMPNIPGYADCWVKGMQVFIFPGESSRHRSLILLLCQLSLSLLPWIRGARCSFCWSPCY